jgi:hypothetical protein
MIRSGLIERIETQHHLRIPTPMEKPESIRLTATVAGSG